MTLAKDFIRLLVRWWAVLGILPAAYYAYFAYLAGSVLVDNADVAGAGSQNDVADAAIELLFGVAMGGAISAIPAAIFATIHAFVRYQEED